MKKMILIMLAALSITGTIIVLPINGEEEIYDKVIRLHILANSDSDEDQRVKLLVRDSLLEYVSCLISDAEDIEAAKAIISEHIGDIETVAENVLINEGFGDSASAEIGYEVYPERGYDGLKLPAGEYCSLRVSIGRAEGHNWWCVLFPPLCLSASKPKDVLVQAGFTENQVRILADSDNPKYDLRFKFLEVLQSFKRR